MKQVTITGMSCEHCQRASTQALEELGLKNVRVDLANGVATFDEAGISEQSVIDAIADAGFEAVSFN